jgi:uncharacterized coiled-coil protein SlyX
MGLERYDHTPNEGLRRWLGVIKGVVTVVLFISFGLFCYQFAVERGKTHQAAREETIAGLNRQIAELQALAQQQQQTIRTAEKRTKDLEARLTAEVPTGDRAQLLKLLVERMEAGVTPDRLSLVLSHTRMPANCAAMDEKRIAVNTPRSKSGPKAAGFANGLVSVSAEGESSKEKATGSETPFDPGQPVRVRVFNPATGKETYLNGVLPQRLSLVAGGREVRLTFAAGTRTAILATAESCDFP